ncbi:hypothetical protein U1Q18_046736 [Sarracenia purpurea var. burkii]
MPSTLSQTLSKFIQTLTCEVLEKFRRLFDNALGSTAKLAAPSCWRKIATVNKHDANWPLQKFRTARVAHGAARRGGAE